MAGFEGNFRGGSHVAARLVYVAALQSEAIGAEGHSVGVYELRVHIGAQGRRNEQNLDGGRLECDLEQPETSACADTRKQIASLRMPTKDLGVRYSSNILPEVLQKQLMMQETSKTASKILTNKILPRSHKISKLLKPWKL